MPIHMMQLKYAPERLRALVLVDRTMDEDQEMADYFEAVKEQHIFIDTYGPECILAQVGLSWWRDIVPCLDDNFVLCPEACDVVANLIMSKMPPSPTKVIEALAEGTELTYCVENYPHSHVVRDPGLPFTAEEQGWLFFNLGRLIGFLHNGAKSQGILVSS